MKIIRNYISRHINNQLKPPIQRSLLDNRLFDPNLIKSIFSFLTPTEISAFVNTVTSNLDLLKTNHGSTLKKINEEAIQNIIKQNTPSQILQIAVESQNHSLLNEVLNGDYDFDITYGLFDALVKSSLLEDKTAVDMILATQKISKALMLSLPFVLSVWRFPYNQ